MGIVLYGENTNGTVQHNAPPYKPPFTAKRLIPPSACGEITVRGAQVAPGRFEIFGRFGMPPEQHYLPFL